MGIMVVDLWGMRDRRKRRLWLGSGEWADSIC